jgi:hypothetical protein
MSAVPPPISAPHIQLPARSLSALGHASACTSSDAEHVEQWSAKSSRAVCVRMGLAPVGRTSATDAPYTQEASNKLRLSLKQVLYLRELPQML